MAEINLIKHAPGAPGLRWFGLGPGLRPANGVFKLKELLDNHTFWARGRSKKNLKRLLAGSNVVVSLWCGNKMIGFGRATTDKIYRAVLWDVVVAKDHHGEGLGKKIVEALVKEPGLRAVERIYLMTTHCSDFYLKLGFKSHKNQKLLLREQL